MVLCIYVVQTLTKTFLPLFTATQREAEHPRNQRDEPVAGDSTPSHGGLG